ncbi:MAG TPA: hypothetical protein VFJ63_01875, partial [Candidatus Bathyarchaeia archaeon]|nr:hypothetical protein [Candidatus Bathyarchaeia archaeon]
HGPVGTVEDIAKMRDYYDMLQKTVEGLDPKDKSQVAHMTVPARFSGWKWNSFYKANLESLLQKKASTTK